MDRIHKKPADALVNSLKRTSIELADESKHLRSESLRLRAASQQLAERVKKQVERSKAGRNAEVMTAKSAAA